MNQPNAGSTVDESGSRSILNRASAAIEHIIAHDFLALIARVSIATIFLLSGRTKVEGFLSVTDTAVFLFREEYKLPFLSPSVGAHVAAYAEHLFPALLLLGLCTRFSALALLGMTAVIQVFVYPDAWPTHLSWAMPLLYLLGRGAGVVSLDKAFGIR